ncbi:copper resistance CopC family protein [Ilumatobacter sp.]|uniref:copper resistance CopC family protein n=1 Tax=Ilumatobacter sp. TaxID=1967498 RepID=UPI003C5914EE
MNRWFAAAVTFSALCVVTLTATATAQAHASLESSNPAEGSVVTVLPDVVELTFTEVVGLPADVAVTDPNGVSVGSGEVSVVDRAASQPIAVSDPQPGAYVIAYQVTSADGHPISGRLTFTLDAPSGAPSTAAIVPADTGAAATTSLPVQSVDTPTTVGHDSMSSHTTPPTAVATTTTTPARVVAAPVSPSQTPGSESGDSNPTVIVTLLIAAAAGVTIAGLAVRRAARRTTAKTEPSAT